MDLHFFSVLVSFILCLSLSLSFYRYFSIYHNSNIENKNIDIRIIFTIVCGMNKVFFRFPRIMHISFDSFEQNGIIIREYVYVDIVISGIFISFFEPSKWLDRMETHTHTPRYAKFGKSNLIAYEIPKAYFYTHTFNNKKKK